MPRPASKMGLASLPPIDHFLSVQLQADFKTRGRFEEEADRLHDELLHQRGILEQDHLQAHQDHFTENIRIAEARSATLNELKDIGNMLSQRGVEGGDFPSVSTLASLSGAIPLSSSLSIGTPVFVTDRLSDPYTQCLRAVVRTLSISRRNRPRHPRPPK